MLSTITNLSNSQDSYSQLEKISKRLTGFSFHPLHPSLLKATADNQHAPGTLTDTQAYYLYNAFNDLINEYENRGNTIQNLMMKLSRNNNESTTDKEVIRTNDLTFSEHAR